MTPEERRKAARRLLRSSFRGRGRELRRLAGWSLLEALPAVLSGLLVARAIDDGFLASSTATGFAWLGGLALAVVAGALGTRQANQQLATLVEPFRNDLAILAVGNSLRLSVQAGARPDTAAVARLTQQVEIVREAYASVLMVVQGFLVTALGAVIGLSTLFPLALVLVVPPLLLGVALFLLLLPRMSQRQRDSIMADERIAVEVNSVAEGLRDVVACGAEARVGADVGQHIDRQAQATKDVAQMTAVGSLSIAAGGWLPVLLVLIGGSWLVDHGASTGVILGVLTYVSQGVHGALQTFVRGLAGPGLWLLVTLGRIVEVAPPAGLPKVKTTPSEDDGRPDGGHDLRLIGVGFAYGERAERVIDRLNLTVPHGEHLAVVGPSGVGKSTLANLITGVLEPQEGEILVRGVALGDLDAASRAQYRVLIPQEAYVFGGPLIENLAYLKPQAAEAEIDRAVDELGAHPLVERLGGYEAELDPSELSPGERQLITLVRAYVSEAELAVLDEATCYLDPRLEARAERAFARRPGTLFVIAHRMSSALRANRVLLLDGTDVRFGTHAELLSESQLYRDLVGHWDSGVPAPA